MRIVIGTLSGCCGSGTYRMICGVVVGVVPLYLYEAITMSADGASVRCNSAILLPSTRCTVAEQRKLWVSI